MTRPTTIVRKENVVDRFHLNGVCQRKWTRVRLMNERSGNLIDLIGGRGQRPVVSRSAVGHVRRMTKMKIHRLEFLLCRAGRVRGDGERGRTVVRAGIEKTLVDAAQRFVEQIEILSVGSRRGRRRKRNERTFEREGTGGREGERGRV